MEYTLAQLNSLANNMRRVARFSAQLATDAATVSAYVRTHPADVDSDAACDLHYGLLDLTETLVRTLVASEGSLAQAQEMWDEGYNEVAEEIQAEVAGILAHAAVD